MRVGSGADCEEDDEEEGLEVEESGLWEGVGVWLAGCLGGRGEREWWMMGVYGP